MDEAAARRALAAWLPDAAPAAGVVPLGAGHINDTWLVTTPAGRRVLQRINGTVFPQPAAIARKVAAVTAHLHGHPRVTVPALCVTADGAAWHEDAAGVWRLAEFVAGSRTLQALSTPAQARAAGAAFGYFQVAMAGLTEPLPDPVPGFMRLAGYLHELDGVLGRAEPAEPAAREALRAITARRDLANEFRAGERIIHGDCKVDNLLFRRDGDRVLAIIDLDTVMAGHWAWDLGDLVRSAAADGERFSVERCAAVAGGFVGTGAAAAQGGSDLVDALLLAPRYVALMLGVRFLTDHLRGDRYFKVAARGDNLRRALEQLRLLADMERQERPTRAALTRRRSAPG